MSHHEDEDALGLGWFLAGVIIGAAVALLYAPKSGKATREYLAEKAQEGKEAVADAGKDVFAAGQEMYEKGRHLVEDAADLFERGRKLVRG
ncbi:MAG TPA: YtxH domain-containing protein [Bryobacteraceae bacterium]|nr:YtxH domain-containing protein [Bryobacteraceae bacterium]